MNEPRERRAPEHPLSPSAILLGAVATRLGSVRQVAKELGVMEGTIRHVLRGRWPPKRVTRERCHELWGIPLDTWGEAPPTAELPPGTRLPPPTPEQLEAATARAMEPRASGFAPAPLPPTVLPAAQGTGYCVLVQFDTPAQAQSFRDKVVRAGATARIVDSVAPGPVTAITLTEEAVGYLRGVVRDKPGGRQTGAGISAANALLAHARALQPGEEGGVPQAGSLDAELNDGQADGDGDDEDPQPLAN